MAEYGRIHTRGISELAFDILEQPHVLIAGVTGSGKSTMLDTILTALCTYPAYEKSFVVIDLKRVSVSRWRRVQNCREYVTEPSDVSFVLDSLISEIDKRFRTMEKQGRIMSDECDLYCVVDEAADLLDSVKDSYTKLKKIARLGRAAKVHLILCTQSPNRKTIPADLTININARLGLRVDSAIESRQIINAAGCEELPMYGRGLYRSPQNRSAVSVHIQKLSDEAIESIIRLRS